MSRDRTGFAARSRVIGLSLVLGLTLAACAAGRSVVDVQPPASHAAKGAGFARIAEIRDMRQFDPAPRDPSTPSLSDAGEISNPAITARAIARKRNGYGRAMGDVVLPEGNTVAGLVRAAATKALQDSGYTVVDEKSPNYAAALPLAIDIEQFWAWFTPGAFLVTIEFNGRIVMKGDALVGRDLGPVRASATYDSAAIFESDWTKIVEQGLDDMSGRMKERIKAPGTAAIAPAPAQASIPPVAAATPEIRPAAPADTKPPAVAAAPAPEKPRTGVLANDIDGRWIVYSDYVLDKSPMAEHQEALLSRCSKSYATFSVKGSKLVIDTHQGADSRHSEHAISNQRTASLVYSEDSVRGARFTTVSFGTDHEPTRFGLSPDVLVFEPRTQAVTVTSAYGGSRKYARCPMREAAE
jgi:hypothetical protein